MVIFLIIIQFLVRCLLVAAVRHMLLICHKINNAMVDSRLFCHTSHLLTTELAQTLTYSLILSRIYYCNAMLYGAPMTTINKLQRIQNNEGLCCRC